jgi:hypothetical protein
MLLVKVIANIVTVVGGFIIVLVYSLLTPKTVKELQKYGSIAQHLSLNLDLCML